MGRKRRNVVRKNKDKEWAMRAWQTMIDEYRFGVSNYVDYINYLNDGTTKMKGHHMAEHAIAAAKGKAKFI